MDKVIKAVNARLLAQVGKAAHVFEVPEGTALPYLVLSIPSEVPRYTWTSVRERIRVQIDVYAAGKVEALTLAGAVKAAMDECEMEVEGYELLHFQREFSQPLKDGDAWRVIVEYAVELQHL